MSKYHPLNCCYMGKVDSIIWLLIRNLCLFNILYLWKIARHQILYLKGRNGVLLGHATLYRTFKQGTCSIFILSKTWTIIFYDGLCTASTVGTNPLIPTFWGSNFWFTNILFCEFQCCENDTCPLSRLVWPVQVNWLIVVFIWVSSGVLRAINTSFLWQWL